MFELKTRYLCLLLQAKGIEVSFQVPTAAVAIYQFADSELLSLMFRIDARSRDRNHPRLVLGQQQKVILDGGMGDIGSRCSFHNRQGFKIAAPLIGDFRRIFKILLVEFFHIGGIAG